MSPLRSKLLLGAVVAGLAGAEDDSQRGFGGGPLTASRFTGEAVWVDMWTDSACQTKFMFPTDAPTFHLGLPLEWTGNGSCFWPMLDGVIEQTGRVQGFCQGDFAMFRYLEGVDANSSSCDETGVDNSGDLYTMMGANQSRFADMLPFHRFMVNTDCIGPFNMFGSVVYTKMSRRLDSDDAYPVCPFQIRQEAETATATSTLPPAPTPGKAGKTTKKKKASVKKTTAKKGKKASSKKPTAKKGKKATEKKAKGLKGKKTKGKKNKDPSPFEPCGFATWVHKWVHVGAQVRVKRSFMSGVNGDISVEQGTTGTVAKASDQGFAGIDFDCQPGKFCLGRVRVKMCDFHKLAEVKQVQKKTETKKKSKKGGKKGNKKGEGKKGNKKEKPLEYV